MTNNDIIVVIEIGSGSVRLLVCQPNGADINILSTNAMLNDINPKCNEKDAKLQLETTKTIVEKFCEQAESYKSNSIFIFGTEALRELSKKHLDLINSFLPSVYIMSTLEESMCSFFAPPILNSTRNRTVIDFGTRSIEISNGITAEPNKIRAYSIQFNAKETYALMKEKSFTPIKTHKYLISFLDKYEIKSSNESEVILMGSVFTNLTWVRVNVGVNNIGNYSPNIVDGYQWQSVAIRKLVKSVRASDNNLKLFQKAIKNTYPNKDGEVEKLTLGLFMMSILFSKIKNKTSRISVRGTRHGTAKLIYDGIITIPNYKKI